MNALCRSRTLSTLIEKKRWPGKSEQLSLVDFLLLIRRFGIGHGRPHQTPTARSDAGTNLAVPSLRKDQINAVGQTLYVRSAIDTLSISALSISNSASSARFMLRLGLVNM